MLSFGSYLSKFNEGEIFRDGMFWLQHQPIWGNEYVHLLYGSGCVYTKSILQFNLISDKEKWKN